MSGLDCEWFSKFNNMGIDPCKVENITNIGTSVEIEKAFKGRDGGLVGRQAIWTFTIMNCVAILKHYLCSFPFDNK